MTGVPSYSTTASENVNSNTGINWDEGMSPAAVNNSARQNMADMRLQWNDASWFQYGTGSKTTVIPVYVASTQFKIVGVDVTTYWHVGRRVKAVGSSTGTIYGTISVSAFSSDTTVTVVWDSGSLSNETLTIYAGTIQATGDPVHPNAIAWSSTNNNATAGSIGEYVESVVTNASPLSISNSVTANLTSISLTAGDWDVSAQFQIVAAGTATNMILGINTTSATFPNAELYNSCQMSATGARFTINVPSQRVSLSATTTVYAVIQAAFSSTATACGFIHARRVR